MQVHLLRAGRLDCVHEVAACAVSAEGALAEAAPGDGALPVFLRSCAKPFQAAPAVAAGVLERFGLDDRHLALACASHTATDVHATLAAEILAACGLDEAALRCGVDDAGGRGVRHNCSGNHGMGLALCVAEGWPTDGYLAPEHPLQAAMRAAVAAAAGETPAEGGDGCGMRAYQVTLRAAARMFGRLATADGALGRCAAAMRAHPELVRGEGELDTRLMRAVPGLVSKCGAEAAQGVGLADGRGLAVKVRDGGWRALAPATLAAAGAFLGLEGALGGLDDLLRPSAVDNRGEVVGSLVASVTWERRRSS
jgi:L-asparaginase II